MENRVYGLVILEVVQVLVERSKVSSLKEKDKILKAHLTRRPDLV